MRDENRMRRVVWLMVLLVVVLFIAALVIHRLQSAQVSTLQQKVNTVASQLRAPGDPSTVAVSSLGNAQTMRFEIEQDLQKGMSTQQVLNLMVQQYGEGVLATPRFSGFGEAVWIMPWLALTLLGAGVLFFLRKVVKARRSDREGEQDVRPLDSPLLRTHSDTDHRVAERLKDYL